MILCSSDPYAVVGVMAAFKIVPDLVAGITTSTIAGRELVGKLTGVKALNVIKQAIPAGAFSVAKREGIGKVGGVITGLQILAVRPCMGAGNMTN